MDSAVTRLGPGSWILKIYTKTPKGFAIVLTLGGKLFSVVTDKGELLKPGPFVAPLTYGTDSIQYNCSPSDESHSVSAHYAALSGSAEINEAVLIWDDCMLIDGLKYVYD